MLHHGDPPRACPGAARRAGRARPSVRLPGAKRKPHAAPLAGVAAVRTSPTVCGVNVPDVVQTAWAIRMPTGGRTVAQAYFGTNRYFGT